MGLGNWLGLGNWSGLGNWLGLGNWPGLGLLGLRHGLGPGLLRLGHSLSWHGMPAAGLRLVIRLCRTRPSGGGRAGPRGRLGAGGLGAGLGALGPSRLWTQHGCAGAGCCGWLRCG